MIEISKDTVKDTYDREHKAVTEHWIRNVPHVNGNWASHIYVKVRNSRGLQELAENCVAHFKRVSRQWKDLQNTTVGMKRLHSEMAQDASNPGTAVVMNDFSQEGFQHLSLSKCFYLRQHQIEPFQLELRRAVEGYKSFCIELLEDYEVLVNEAGTRTFISASIGGGEHHLKRLISKIDPVLIKYKADPYYPDPKFHVSIASIRGDFNNTNLDIKAQTSPEDEVDVLDIDVDTLECKIGNKLLRIKLS